MIGLQELEMHANPARAFANRDVWRTAYAFFRPYRLRIAAMLLVNTVSTFFALAQPFFFRELLDAVVGQKVPGRPTHALGTVIAGLTVVGALNALTTVGAFRFAARLSQNMLLDLQCRLYDKLQHMSFGFFVHAKTGAVINFVTGEVDSAVALGTGTISSVFNALFTLVAGLALLSALDWRIGAVLALLAVFVTPSRWIAHQVRRRTVEQFTSRSRYTTVVQETLSISGALLTRLFGMHEANLRAFREPSKRFRDAGISAATWVALGQAILAMGVVTAVSLMAWIGSRLVVSGALSVGTVALLLFYVRILAAPFSTYSSVRYDLVRGVVAFSRIKEVLEAEPYLVVPASRDTSLPERFDGRLELRDVGFTYPRRDSLVIPSLTLDDVAIDEADAEPVLTDVSLTVDAGRFVALVGPSGAGKTTIASLAARLYDPTSGQVLIDGTDVRRLDLAQLTRAVGLVTQDTYLFHDTIRANVMCARPGATDKELVQACRTAGIHEFVRSLPRGYSTIVGERGVRLSGGQRQRLAFARIVLLDPSVIVLDEATAHLDAESESLLRDAVDSVLRHRTRLVIAHRLSTVVGADEILVLERGRITERGTHDELMSVAGRYASLYRTQLLRHDAVPA